MNISFDAIITLLIFLIGLPALLLQSLPEELRTIVRKNLTLIYLWPLLPIASSIALVKFSISFLNSNQLSETNMEIFWAVIFFILIFITAISVFLLAKKWQRREVVNFFTKNIIKDIGKNPNNHKDNKHLKYLRNLGRDSDAGEDKQLVLWAFKEIADTILNNPDYDGDKFEYFIRFLEDILVDDARVDESNFEFASEILGKISCRAIQNGWSHDVKFCCECVSLFARYLMSKVPPLKNPAEVSSAQIKLFGVLQFDYPVNKDSRGEISDRPEWPLKACFEIGAEAIEQGHTFTAIAALSHLDSVATIYSDYHAQYNHRLLGLCAHFWGQEGSAREYVMPILKDDDTFYKKTLPITFKRAIEEYQNQGLFKTVDLLIDMRAYLLPQRRKAGAGK